MPILPLIALLSAAPGGRPATPLPHATIREWRDTLVTYPFSDPNPIPVMGRIYPYFRFEGFTSTPIRKAWTVVELENAFIKVRILPEIGGKIWSAIEKRSGRAFIYDNHVVKFRDIALRGPWTSGGIEANYGIIGHTPNVATPVDYLTRRNPDGSVTCVIAALDLLTRTRWQLEISLPSDKAYFTTSSTWHNPTPYEQPYYSWMNAAIPARDDLEYVYDGTRYIGHDGETGDWPVNHANGKAISWYQNNDFGGYKSYHVFGAYTDFFGAYWHAIDFGMARYAPHDEKPGKKLWIWGLSRQGMIWEQLLTDHDGQYSEVQSGRLFNQTSDASSRTPFTHRGFAPYSTDRWTEYWMPVVGTGGFVAANTFGALNVRPVGEGILITISPTQRLIDTLTVYDGARLVQQRLVTLAPLVLFTDTVLSIRSPDRIRIVLGSHKLEYLADMTARTLSRPVVRVAGVDSNSVSRRTAAAEERVHERDYAGAAAGFRAALAADSDYAPALNGTAALALRRGDAPAALPLLRRALSLDTYDPEANYLFGLASRAVGATADARDGFDIASQSVEYRTAAYTELSRTYLRDGDETRAVAYATHALDYNRFNLDAWQLRALADRVHATGTAEADRQAILAIEPLNHFVAVERWLERPTAVTRAAAMALVRNEMPAQTFIELAIWYVATGRLHDADQVLTLAPTDAIALYWRAYLHHLLRARDVAEWLALGDAASPRLVFPFRPESAVMLRWAVTETSGWQAEYYLALCEWASGSELTAYRRLAVLGHAPDFAPFYAARASVGARYDSAVSRADLQHAAALDPTEWRYGRLLAERSLADGDAKTAVQVATAYHQRFPDNSSLSVLLARALLRADRPDEARTLLDQTVVLPYEGAGEAHDLYREANLRVAFARLRNRDPNGALTLIAAARQWPERLGAGKPYPPALDERLEDWLSVLALAQAGRGGEAAALLARLLY